ncbi:amidohydrolase [Arenibacterium halophilum]|uniref:Amidohydrolase n=1 Tax=Arenibacterium halophilum TaxID=2583821 RepID=A0ABY2XDD5_9RHOB|nr:amidohydrolase [Arenibacterium halophilum]
MTTSPQTRGTDPQENVTLEDLVDSHFHIWDLNKNYYPWLTDKISQNVAKVTGDYRSIRQDYLIDHFRADIGSLNVVAAVHVQADADPKDSVNETAWLQSVADSTGNGMPQGIVARGDLSAPDAAEIIMAHCQYANMRGMRVEMHPGLNAAPDYDPLKDETWLRNFALLREHGLVFEVRAASPEQTDGLIRLMREHPDTTFIFPHLGLSIWRDEDSVAAWKRNLQVYRELGNVYVKLSGYGLFGLGWTIEEVRPYVLECIDTMGPDRLVCGSNYPVDSMAASYHRIWETHSALLDDAGCDSAERRLILRDNAMNVYRL